MKSILVQFMKSDVFENPVTVNTVAVRDKQLPNSQLGIGSQAKELIPQLTELQRIGFYVEVIDIHIINQM